MIKGKSQVISEKVRCSKSLPKRVSKIHPQDFPPPKKNKSQRKERRTFCQIGGESIRFSLDFPGLIWEMAFSPMKKNQAAQESHRKVLGFGNPNPCQSR